MTDKKIKVLTISDHPLSPSGVGIQTKNMIDGYYSDSNIDYENYFELKLKLSDKLSLTNLFDYNNFKEVEFYKFKLGLEYEI